MALMKLTKHTNLMMNIFFNLVKYQLVKNIYEKKSKDLIKLSKLKIMLKQNTVILKLVVI